MEAEVPFFCGRLTRAHMETDSPLITVMVRVLDGTTKGRPVSLNLVNRVEEANFSGEWSGDGYAAPAELEGLDFDQGTFGYHFNTITGHGRLKQFQSAFSA